MVILLRITVCILLFLILIPFSHAAPKVIISGHPDYPPIMWHDGKTIKGAAVRMIQTIFDELKVSYQIKYTGPWKRVQKNAEKGLVDIIVAAYKNPERETFLDYSIPFMSDPVVIFVLSDKVFPFDTWKDLIGKRGNTNIGESYGEKFDRYIEKHLIVERVPKTVHNFMKLDAGRSDYAIIGLYPGLASAYVNGYKNKLKYLAKPIIEENFYVTFSKKSRHRHLMPQVNAYIKKFRAENRIKEWIDEYLSIYYNSQPLPPVKESQDLQ